jgi:hypothetical protein
VPGLRGYPESDAVLKTIADQLWGADRSASEHRFGKGRLVWGQSPDEVLAANGILPVSCFCRAMPAKGALEHRARKAPPVFLTIDRTERGKACVVS